MKPHRHHRRISGSGISDSGHASQAAAWKRTKELGYCPHPIPELSATPSANEPDKLTDSPPPSFRKLNARCSRRKPRYTNSKTATAVVACFIVRMKSRNAVIAFYAGWRQQTCAACHFVPAYSTAFYSIDFNDSSIFATRHKRFNRSTGALCPCRKTYASSITDITGTNRRGNKPR